MNVVSDGAGPIDLFFDNFNLIWDTSGTLQRLRCNVPNGGWSVQQQRLHGFNLLIGLVVFSRVGRASVDESSKDDLGLRMLDHHFSHRTKVTEQIGARRDSRKEGGE